MASDGGVAARAVPEPAQVGDDLVERRVDEPVELDLGDRPGTRQGHAYRRADDAGLVERRVDHPVGAESLVEPIGDPEHPAGHPDVLAEDDGGVVPLHRLVEGGVDRLGHGPALRGAVGELVVAHLPDLVGGEDGLRFAVGPLHGVELVDDVGGDPGEGVADGVVAAGERPGLDLGDGGFDQVGGLHRHLLAGGLVPLAA